MARPPKDGFTYFPLETEFDEKVRSIQMIYQNDGTAWVVRFLQRAYMKNSGEVDLRPPFDELFSREIHCTIERMREITALAISVGFCREVTPMIYTSNGIQKRIEQILKEREEARERKNKRKEKGSVHCSGGKPVVRPENPLFAQTTPQNTDSSQNSTVLSEPQPGTKEYQEFVSDEIKKAQDIIEKRRLLLLKITSLKGNSDNEKPL